MSPVQQAPGGAMSTPSRADVVRRAGLVAAAATPVAALAVAYGFLETVRHHPSLKLGGAMTIAGLAAAVLLVARPAHRRERRSPGHEHSALVEVRPALFVLACASMGAAVIHFAVIEQHPSQYWVYGWFFVLVGVAQLVWAALALVPNPTPGSLRVLPTS